MLASRSTLGVVHYSKILICECGFLGSLIAFLILLTIFSPRLLESMILFSI